MHKIFAILSIWDLKVRLNNIMRNIILVALLLCVCWGFGEQEQPPCPPAQYIQFVQKTVLNPEPIIPDPYKNPSSEYLAKV